MATANAIAIAQEARDREQAALLKDIQQKLDLVIAHLGISTDAPTADSSDSSSAATEGVETGAPASAETTGSDQPADEVAPAEAAAPAESTTGKSKHK